MLQSNGNQLPNKLIGINGDTAIAFISPKKLQASGFMDKAAYVDSFSDPRESSHRKHLGLIETMASTFNRRLPMIHNLLKDMSVMELEPGVDSITYDLPIEPHYYECLTAADTSEFSDKPGFDGTLFPLKLNTEFQKGSILTYDLQDGVQVIVDNNIDVERDGDTYTHMVKMSSNSKYEYFPTAFLKAGVKYFRTGHVMGEFETDYMNLSMHMDAPGFVTNEWFMSDPMGIEFSMTSKVDRLKSKALGDLTGYAIDQVRQQAIQFGIEPDMPFVIGKPVVGSNGNPTISPNGAMVGEAYQLLMLSELQVVSNYQNLFADSAVFTDSRGSKRIAEGAWKSLRRGYRITYSMKGGITRDHIRQAANYVYGNSSVNIIDRVISFKGGTMAWYNMTQLFREEILHQFSDIASLGLFGTDSQVNGKMFEGTIETGLIMKPLILKGVVIADIGRVLFDLDTTLDYMPIADRRVGGFSGTHGMAKTSYSMVIYNAMSNMYHNAGDKVRGAKTVEGGNKNSNMYYVTPAGGALTTGYEQGRMRNGSQTRNIQSSMSGMVQTHWGQHQSSILTLDTTRYVIIELD